jgi:hypothetical protein
MMKRIMLMCLAVAAVVLLDVSAAMSGEAAPPQTGGTSPAQPAAQAPKPPEGYAYKGQPRTKIWFDQMYAKFSDKIACVDGKYIDVGLARLQGLKVQGKEPPKPGTELRTAPVHSKILQVLGKEKVLVRRDEFRARMTSITGGPSSMPSFSRELQEAAASLPEVLFHVKGLDTSQIVNDAAFPEKTDLIYAGTHMYRTPSGATNTVQSFAVYKPLTPEQFVDALSSGFVLVEHRLVPAKLPDEGKRKPGWAIGLAHKDGKYYKPVSQPVP